MNKYKEKKMKEFDDFVYRYEIEDDFNLLSACRAKYGDVAVDDFLESTKDFISQAIDECEQRVKDEIIKEVENLPTGMFDSTPYKEKLIKSIKKI